MVKVLVVGQLPPPHLGQPIMLEILVRSRMPGVELRHLPMQLSHDASDVGHFRWTKLMGLFSTVARLVWASIAYRPDILYFAPAAATRISMWRDVAILAPVRLLFRKTVLHFHAGGHGGLYLELPRWQQWLFRRTYFHADAAIRLSELTPDDGQRLLARREYIVPNGIEDLGAGVPPRPLAPVSAARPLRILFVALLCESKGLLVLIEACGRLKQRGVPFRLEVMGRFENAEFEARVRARIAELDLHDDVHFLGQQIGADKLAAFARADVLCHPSFFDTFGIVLLEAMSCRLPVVATRYCSIPTIVDEGRTGFLVKPRDAQGVADRLERLAVDPVLRQRMGEAGREKFLREYTVPRHIERMRRAFLDLMGQPVAADDPMQLQAIESPRRDDAPADSAYGAADVLTHTAHQ
jgi:glycosyltransferase involved in cell wall biosynthesis